MCVVVIQYVLVFVYLYALRYSRFDLIFLVLDPQDEVFDRRLASHLVSLYYKDYTNSQDDQDIVVSVLYITWYDQCPHRHKSRINIKYLLLFQDMSLMRDYIAFAKEHVQPKLSETAQQRLIDAYVDMR